MPSIHVIRETSTTLTPRDLQIGSLFDVTPTGHARMEWQVNCPYDEHPWNIGLIVGPSGSGKTTVARELFGSAIVENVDWPKSRSVASAFPSDMSVRELSQLINAVGFSSPPAWLRPYCALSTGEQFRITVARILAERRELAVIDEFTSVVDRQVAKVACHAAQKAIRNRRQRLVAVSCHYDIIDWLQPDWLYQPGDNHFARRSLQRHPAIELAVYKIDRAAWRFGGIAHAGQHERDRRQGRRLAG